MRILLAIVLMAGMGCSLFQPAFTPTLNQKMEGKASYVIDGDTFYFSFDHGKFKATLANLNAPNIQDKGGRESFEFLRSLIHQKTVNIEYLGMDPEGRWMVNASLSTGENIQDQVRANLAPLTK
jgi:endonuclease YncB( thermonuclease family)